MEENNNNEKTIIDKGKDFTKRKAKNAISKKLMKIFIRILPYIGIFFLILLVIGLMLAAQAVIQNVFDSILGVFDPKQATTTTTIQYSSNLLEAAQQVHDEERDWIYHTEHKLKDDSLVEPVSNALINPNKTTCCATYVSCVLYASGYFTEEEIGWNLHAPYQVNTLLEQNAWQKIEDENQLQPGDIVFLENPGNDLPIDHVQIYAGDNKWYNAGNTADIQGIAPKENSEWKKGWKSWWAYRAPGEPTNPPVSRTSIDYNGRVISIDEEGAYKLNVKNLSEQILAELQKQKVNNEVIGFNTDEIGNMIDKYIRAEVKTSYPKTEHPDNDEDGIIIIKRASANEGKVVDLKYKSYEEFSEAIEQQKMETLGWFSINPNTFKLCIATQNPSIEYKDFSGATTSIEGGGIVKKEIDYQKYVKNHVTPVKFLLVLHLVSQDVEFMEDVLDLALGKGKINPIELTYVDTKYITTEQHDYNGKINYSYSNGQYDSLGLPKSTDINNSNVGQYYDAAYHQKITSMYTGRLCVSNANTWLISSSKSISEKANVAGSGTGGPTTGEPTLVKSDSIDATSFYVTDPSTGENIMITMTGKITINEIVSTSNSLTEFTVVDKQKQIKVDEFIELIQKYPKVLNRFITAPSNIFYYLHQSENTQIHEKIMRYVLYRLTDIDYGVLEGDLDDLLKIDLNEISAGASILTVAQQIHDAQRHYIYYTEHPSGLNSLTGGNIEKAIDNPKQTTCCATYVWSVLYKAGYFTEEEVNSTNYNSQVFLNAKLRELGWEKIVVPSELEPGDIVFMEKPGGSNPDHVQIYAGDNKWYNAGSTYSIQGEAPYENANWMSGWTSWWAYRPPVIETNYPEGIKTISNGLYFFPEYPQSSTVGSKYILYANEQYGNYPDKTLGTSGCATYAMSSIASGLLRDNTIDPKTYLNNLNEYYPSRNYYSYGNGSNSLVYADGFLQKYYKLHSKSCTSESEMLKAFEDFGGDCAAIGYEYGHFIAIIPIIKDSEGYKFYVIDSARGHTGKYKSGADYINSTTATQFGVLAIIYK